MGDASYTQASFLGGEWSPYAQGRTDIPGYKTAMAVSVNGYPVEEGAWVRRPGFKFLFPTRDGNPARRFLFAYSTAFPYVMEFTDLHLRVSIGDNLVMDSAAVVASISQADPAVVTTQSPTGWATDDVVQFIATAGTNTLAPVINRQFVITVLTTTTFTLQDPITDNPVDGLTLGWDASTMSAQVSRVLDITTPYAGGSWYNSRIVQFNKQAVILNPAYPPYTLTLAVDSDPTGQFNQFSLLPSGPPGLENLEDGPYFDAVDGSTVTPSSTSGAITVTFDDDVGPNQNVLLAGDVGRLIRFYSTPPVFDVGHAYSAGDHVMYGAGVTPVPYTAVAATAGQFPDISPDAWVLDPGAAQWVPGVIVEVLSFNQASVQLIGDLLYAADVTTWRFGRFGGQEGWPRGGCFHEGRLWLCMHGEIFSSMVNDPFVFSPTDGPGNVADNNGITYTLEAGTQDDNDLLWMHSDLSGIICGSAAGEWLIQASTLTDPLTPTTTQAKRVTKYGCADVTPVKAPLALVFVQKQGKRIMEFLPDVFTGKYLAPNISERGKHLTTAGIEEVAYMETITPIIWVRTTDGQLRGITYRRKSSFPSEDAAIMGWHRHGLGSGRTVTSSIVVPAAERSVDTLDIVTSDGSARGYWVERSTKQFDTGDTLFQSFHLDEAAVTTAIVTGDTGVGLYGAYHLAGETVGVWLGGLDCGDYTVAANGSVFVPYQSDPGGLLTNAYLASVAGQDFGDAATTFSSSVTTTPARPSIPGTIGEYLASSGFQLLGISLPTNALILGHQPGGGQEATFNAYNFETRAGPTTVDVRDIVWVIDINLTTRQQSGTNIATYNGSHTYAFSEPVQKNSRCYLSRENGNVGNDPENVPPWKRVVRWDAGVTYQTGYWASLGADFYVSTADSNIGNVPTLGAPWTKIIAWSNGTTYAAGDHVTLGGNFYVSLFGANMGHDPTLGSPWAEVVAWDVSVTYGAGDLAIAGGSFYYSTVGSNLANDPTAISNEPWALLSDWNATAVYNIGDYIVAYLGTIRVVWISQIDNNLNNQPGSVSTAFAWGSPVHVASVTSLGYQFTMGTDGFFYAQVTGGTRAPLYKIHPDTLETVGVFGDAHPSGTSGPNGISYSGGMCAITSGNICYLVSVSAQFADLAVVDGTNMAYAGHDTPDVGSGLVNDVLMCAGRTAASGSDDYSEVFTLNSDGVLWSTRISNNAGNYANLSSAPAWNPVVSYPENQTVFYAGRHWVSLVGPNLGHQPDISPSAWQNIEAWDAGTTYASADVIAFAGSIYTSLQNGNTGNEPDVSPAWWSVASDPKIITQIVDTLVPSSIDTAWTTFVQGALGYDRSDGNLIAYITTTDTVTHKYYIVKINSAIGASPRIMWATPLATNFINGLNLQFSRIDGNTFGVMADDGTITLYNTADGSVLLSHATAGMAPTNVQVYDAPTGHLVVQMNYNSAVTGAPAPLAGTSSTFSQSWADYLPGDQFLGDTISTQVVATGAIIGKVYTSQGQILRPGLAPDAGSANGPPLGKTRRTHMYSALFANAVTTSVQIGTDASIARSNVRAITFKTPGGTPYGYDQFFNGVQWGTLEDTYSFDSMLLWQVPRPYPLTVVSVGGFINTQDR